MSKPEYPFQVEYQYGDNWLHYGFCRTLEDAEAAAKSALKWRDPGERVRIIERIVRSEKVCGVS